MPPMALAEAQVVIFIFWDKIQLNRPICRLYCVFFHMIYEYTTHYQNHSFFNWDISHHGPLESNGTIRNDYNVRATIMNKGPFQSFLIAINRPVSNENSN